MKLEAEAFAKQFQAPHTKEAQEPCLFGTGALWNKNMCNDACFIQVCVCPGSEMLHIAETLRSLCHGLIPGRFTRKTRNMTSCALQLKTCAAQPNLLDHLL